MFILTFALQKKFSAQPRFSLPPLISKCSNSDRPGLLNGYFPVPTPSNTWAGLTPLQHMPYAITHLFVTIYRSAYRFPNDSGLYKTISLIPEAY